MADEEDYDVEVQKTDNRQAERSQRRIEVLQHDTNQARTEEVVEHAQCVLDAMPAEYASKDVAAKLKQRLDTAYGGTWHVIVGRHFGANVTHDADTLINMKIDGVYFLALRSGPPERPMLEPQDESGGNY
ncbi:putative dynein light chain [Leptomonas pyrrhocoris]|uniref:Dynein light chain n=1 Tax=Leptomonas pyrrhocoris TaxID=157538 RepID=A0A0M9G125_LEPPY|nr:putative dynein light chain [Leptomonas pyrrhocoris]XP_015658614.1 putative dynein light chain [Leptomonas pyrrhocoris]KPA80174.1 putative dynein light chain [Leptomonas pyrrhocoris]KPA80175.1 putative dynein light chain [Leptomonas pyrrhocoris]|eukprot:XP_015658613.1 putative dynein light chain [Leptomonas pyrrhocoris]